MYTVEGGARSTRHLSASTYRTRRGLVGPILTILFAFILLLVVLGAHSGATSSLDTERAGEDEGQPQSLKIIDMGDRSRTFRVHNVAAEQDVLKFVLQEASSRSSSSSSSWRTLSFREASTLWQSSSGLVETLAESISAAPFEAVFWESTPVTRTTMDKAYEYILANSPALATKFADGSAFAEHIAAGEGMPGVVSFRNLRKDALLVVPCRAGNATTASSYVHLAKFVRTAPREQIIKFFGAVGAGLEAELTSREDESPVWLSTSGLGVYWLHARLDARPKYYTYTPYKEL